MPRKEKSRTFDVSFTVCATVKISEKALQRGLEADFRKRFYQFTDVKDVAQHISYNLLGNMIKLTSMDGWADMKADDAEASDVEWIDFEATEVKSTKKKKKRRK